MDMCSTEISLGPAPPQEGATVTDRGGGGVGGQCRGEWSTGQG